MLELPVLPADIDHQTVPVKLQGLLFAVLAHLLCILGVLHFDERLKTSRYGSLRICFWISGTPRWRSVTSLLIRFVKYLQTLPKGSASLRMDSSEKVLQGMFPT